MATDILKILNNTKSISLSDSDLESLIDYERVLDQLDLYAYRNWKRGELIEGPIYEKYFVTCRWMYPFRKMPDPDGGMRLINYGCEVSFEKDEYEYPVKVETPDDFKPGTRYPRMIKKPVWVVTIVMPKKLMGDIERGSVELENEIIDAEDIETAYEEGLDEMEQENQQQQQQQSMAQQMVPGAPPAPMPPAVPPALV